MENNLPSSVLTVKKWFEKNNFDKDIIWLSEIARSAQDAANSLKCDIGQIAKSLIFKIKDKEEIILIIASGSNRVSEDLFLQLTGNSIERPDAIFVKDKTGFSIGGIPPIAHKTKISTYIDEDLFKYDEIWAAAGHPYAVFKTNACELKNMSKAKRIKIA